MKILFPLFVLIVSLFLQTGCTAAKDAQGESQAPAPKTAGGSNENNSAKTETSVAKNNSETETVTDTPIKQPKTVREFFNLLPQKYFTLEGCADKPTKENCEKARAAYLKNYLEVEDAANGYMKGGCDGAQSCFTMALFKRPDGTYIVALNKLFEMGEETYFLEYANGSWKDIGAQVVPEYSREKTYELPRYGTNVAVYGLKEIDEGINERGEKLYDLVWKNGKFSIKK
ncbi:MAG TPA: hypothetical protein VF556_18675 [Pyrinomonadaceae bacterium]|jgi:hypothetical protein